MYKSSKKALREVDFNANKEFSILLTDNKKMQYLNKKFRNLSYFVLNKLVCFFWMKTVVAGEVKLFLIKYYSTLKNIIFPKD